MHKTENKPHRGIFLLTPFLVIVCTVYVVVFSPSLSLSLSLSLSFSLSLVFFRRGGATRYLWSSVYRVSRAYRPSCPILRRQRFPSAYRAETRLHPRSLHTRRSFDNLPDIRFARLIGTLVSPRARGVPSSWQSSGEPFEVPRALSFG